MLAHNIVSNGADEPAFKSRVCGIPSFLLYIVHINRVFLLILQIYILCFDTLSGERSRDVENSIKSNA